MAAGEYLMTFINAEKMPRKFESMFFSNFRRKIFSTCKRTVILDFVATKEGKFDGYLALVDCGNKARVWGKSCRSSWIRRCVFITIKAMWLDVAVRLGHYEKP